MRERSGDVCAMTEYRWRKVGILPEPIKINGRNFHYESDVLAIPQRAAEVEARKAAEKAADDAQ
jgi:hypothetical protein